MAAVQQAREEIRFVVVKALAWIIIAIFLIGLLVVFGIFDLII